MNKFIHVLIAAGFAFACTCLWGMLNLMSNVMFARSIIPPAFTQFCIGMKPVFVVLPIVAAAYCLYVCIRKSDSARHWVSFFAATVGSLVVVMLPTLLAVWLPMIQLIDLSVRK